MLNLHITEHTIHPHLSLFEVAYDFNPLTPLNLVALNHVDQLDVNGKTKLKV